MLVTVIGSKICHGSNGGDLIKYITEAEKNNTLGLPKPAKIDAVTLNDEQFVRFKNAGRMHASKKPGKKAGNVDRTRVDRTDDDDLNKWDVAPYGDLTGKSGPWGSHGKTNRDHMTADSSNQLQLKSGDWSGEATTSSGVKSEALAITVSGQHHRDASYTYGGRTKKTDTPDGSTRTRFGATHPTESYQTETTEMLQWKSSHASKTTGQLKISLRIETVGAYAYMYKTSVALQRIEANANMDKVIIKYLRIAVNNDDGVERK